eukprot:6178201-Amphidinium_carterae.1
MVPALLPTGILSEKFSKVLTHQAVTSRERPAKRIGSISEDFAYDTNHWLTLAQTCQQEP